MSPFAWARRTISCAARTWSGSVVRMNRSGLIEQRVLGGLEEADLLVDELARAAALVDGALGDVDRVLVRAGQEPRVVALHPVPARDDVRADHLVQGVQAGLVVGVGDRRGQVVDGQAWSGSWIKELVRTRRWAVASTAASRRRRSLGQDRPERGRPGIAIELPSRTMAR